ncbi:hypothetical protein [Cellulomonas fengjieae]|uniref:hypothetical protein n=1 Tax=Cellulomonas fengjieae TaxID=2819978 RepID=UPI001AAF09DE|nr:hypothetical protein [Cellulomonas fengjieae]MBO3101911.1 hypothetical protein [Cellulomonas fengjieae]
MPIHLVAIDVNGTTWHAERDDGGRWTPFASAGLTIAEPYSVSCALTDRGLQVCATGAGRYVHTIRFDSSTWQAGWGNFLPEGWPDGGADLAFVSVAGFGPRLDVCASGTYGDRAWDRVWVSTRTDGGWTRASAATSKYRPGMTGVAAANVGGDLHVLVRAMDPDGTSHLVHTIRRARTGALQGDHFLEALYPNERVLGGFPFLAAAGVAGQLHVVAGDDRELRHTIRIDDSSWQNTFGSVRAAVDPTFAGPLTRPATTGSVGNLHVFAVSDGRIKHTIRLTREDRWQHPDDASRSGFGDVLDRMPASSGTRPAAIRMVAAGGV